MSAGIPYRAGDFASFRRALLRPLPGEQAINDWRPAPGDLGLQVLEWWAYLADVLSFYNERYASESYLGTATQSGSVTNLAALVGYQPTPGIAATGTLAAIGSARQSAEPLVLPAGMRVSSTASPSVPSQTFEVDAAVCFTGPSTVPVTLPSYPTFQNYQDGSPQSVLISGRVSGIKAGDRLVLVYSKFTGDTDYWSLVTVAGLTPAADPATGVVNTVVGFAPGGWGPTPPPAGEEAPAVPLPPQDSTCYRLLRPTAAAAIMNPAELSEPNPPPRYEHPIVIFDSDTATVQRVHLSAAVRAISPGDLVLFDLGAGNGSALAVVTATSEALWTIPFPSTRLSRPPDIIVAHTVLDLATADFAVLLAARAANSLGSIAVRYGWQDVGTIIGVPPPELNSLGGTAAADYTPSADGTDALLQDATGAGVAVTVLGGAGSGNITLAASGTAPSAIPASVLLQTPLAVPLQLLLNLVPVSRGKTVTGEVLGSGNAALASQSFTLAKSPLTYLRGATGVESTLTVTVNQIAWQQVTSFYGQPASARVFVVTRSPDQTVTTVTFGDGVNGARLPSGAGNVVASYRYGSGQATPLPGRLTTIGQPQLNLASIQNPVPMSGGEDPQADDDVRTAAPASVTTFARAISAADYEQIVSQASGVNQAAASWMFDGTQQRTLVTVYVSGGQAAVASAITALAGTEDPNRAVVVTAANPVELSLSCGLVLAAGQQVSAVLAAAQAAVGGLFSPSGMGIGQRLYRSAIDAALMVPGVTAVRRLEVTGPGQVLGEFLDPGSGAYFDLPPDQVDITAVNGDD
jgi:predicted phage baseplate assembly protein